LITASSVFAQVKQVTLKSDYPIEIDVAPHVTVKKTLHEGMCFSVVRKTDNEVFVVDGVLNFSLPIALTDYNEKEQIFRDSLLKKEQEEKQRQLLEEKRVQKIEFNKTLEKISFTVQQVLPEGVIGARDEGHNYQPIFIEGITGLDEGDRRQICARRVGSFTYTTVMGASSTIQKWVAEEDPTVNDPNLMWSDVGTGVIEKTPASLKQHEQFEENARQFYINH
jgi:hypothetical protein